MKDICQPSLPVIDLDLCIGCGACVEVCPNNVLELINEKSSVVRPENCRQVAACEDVCPVGAISQTRNKRFSGMEKLSELEALEMGMRLEMRIYNLYRRFAEAVEDPEKKKTFLLLANEKEEELQHLQGELVALKAAMGIQTDVPGHYD